MRLKEVGAAFVIPFALPRTCEERTCVNDQNRSASCARYSFATDPPQRARQFARPHPSAYWGVLRRSPQSSAFVGPAPGRSGRPEPLGSPLHRHTTTPRLETEAMVEFIGQHHGGTPHAYRISMRAYLGGTHRKQRRYRRLKKGRAVVKRSRELSRPGPGLSRFRPSPQPWSRPRPLGTAVNAPDSGRQGPPPPPDVGPRAGNACRSA